MLLATGDLHGDVDCYRLHSDAWPIGQRLTRNDYLVILGDFGLDINFNPGSTPKWFYWLSKQPWTTLFIDGNHDDIPYLKSLPKAKMFNGTVGVAHKNVFHLRRGEVYTIGWSTFFVMGGANSIDKMHRTQGIDWWPEEIPSYKEWDYAIANLKKVNYTVDNVLAHTMPTLAAKRYLKERGGLIGSKLSEKDSILEKDFQTVIDNHQLRFNNWYCGHWHPMRRWDYEKYHCFYHHIEPIHICLEDINRDL